VLSALVQGGKTREPAEQLQRFASYRVQTWGFEPLREAISRAYFTYLRKKETEDPALKGQADWELAKDSWLSDRDLCELYVHPFTRLRTPIQQLSLNKA